MLRIYLLGKFATYLDRDEALAFRTRKAEAILYYLVVVDKPVTRAELARLFWPTMSLANAQKNLRAVLPNLRSLLGDYLRATSLTVAFNRSKQHTVDLYQLYALLEDRSLPEAKRLAQIIALAQGELLAGLNLANTHTFEDWLTQQRETLRTRVIETLHHLTERFAVQGAWKEGLDATQLWLRLHPWDETAHRWRMQFFWDGKQRSAALLQYNRCAEYLEEELGVEPSLETKQLYHQIQKDSAPPSAQSENRPQDSKPSIKHNLPAKPEHLVGREAEIAKISGYLLEQRHPIVSIVGEGGVGKTHLALAVAQRFLNSVPAHTFIDGIWFVSCAGIDNSNSTEEHLILHIGTACGMQFQGATTLQKQLINHLYDKSILFIIDNFEHLTNHVQILLTIVQQVKNVQFLVTSRHVLPIQDDLCLHVEGLQVPQQTQYEVDKQLPAEELHHLQDVPSIQLFTEYARRTSADFEIDAQNGVAASKLCHLLDGNPLALTLAAYLLGRYPLPTIVSELLHNYTLLETSLQEIPLRQRSIHNSIDYSWRMLPPEMASTLAQCSIFRGDFTIQAASEIVNCPGQQIRQLMSRSLLTIDDQRRVHIHELVRQFAARKLAQNDSQAAESHRRHAEYYLQMLITWWEGTESKHITTQLVPELDNLYAAWEWAFAHQSFALLSQAIVPLTQFHFYTGLSIDMHSFIESHHQELANQLKLENDPEKQRACQQLFISFIYAQGIYHYLQNDFDQALQCFNEAQTLANEHEYLYLAGYIERFRGSTHWRKGKVEEAEQSYEQAIHFAIQEQQPYPWIRSLLELALCASHRGLTEKSAEYLQHAYTLLQQYPDNHLEVAYYNHQGDIFHAQGRLSESLECYQKAAQINPDKRSASPNLHSVGKILWQSGSFESAKEYLEQVDSVSRYAHYAPGKFWHIIWLIDFANLYVAWEQPKQAQFYSQLALNYAKKQGRTLLMGRALKAEGAAQLQLEQWNEATENLTLALTIFRQLSAADHECTALTQLIHLALRLEDEEETRVYSNSLWKILVEGNPDLTNAEPIKAWWACYVAFLALGDNRKDEALQKAHTLFQHYRAGIHDSSWQDEFAQNIPEHRALLQTIQTSTTNRDDT